MAPKKRLRTTQSSLAPYVSQDTNASSQPSLPDSMPEGPSHVNGSPCVDSNAEGPSHMTTSPCVNSNAEGPLHVNSSSSVDTPANKKTRGPTLMSKIWNLRGGEQITIEFNEMGQPVSDNCRQLSSLTRRFVRDKNIMAIDVPNWKNVKQTHKDAALKIVEEKFRFEGCEPAKIKEWILQNMGKQLRDYRATLRSAHCNSSLPAAEIVANASGNSELKIDEFAKLVEYWKDEKFETKSEKAKTA